MDLHPVVASQVSFECWFLLLTTLRTLSIPSLASILYILPFQLRADINNRFRVQLRLLLTPSILRDNVAETRLPGAGFHYCEPAASIIPFPSILHSQVRLPGACAGTATSLLEDISPFLLSLRHPSLSASPLSRVDSINSFFTSRARALLPYLQTTLL